MLCDVYLQNDVLLQVCDVKYTAKLCKIDRAHKNIENIQPNCALHFIHGGGEGFLDILFKNNKSIIFPTLSTHSVATFHQMAMCKNDQNIQ